MNLTKFLADVDKINANNYNYGNDILYASFNFAKGILPLPGSRKDSKLSSAMSIIGKSYSADPTRSAPSGVLKNNGTGDSFDLLASKIVTHPDYKTLYKRVKDLSLKTFNYQSDVNDDKEILNNTIFCVALLNHILRNVINKIAKDKKINEVSKNTVSFCSKFLHFLCPEVFFIKDSISLSNGNKLSKHYKKSSLTLTIPDFIAKTEVLAISEYLAHVTNSYSIAKILNDNGKTCTPQIWNDVNSTYMPRLVDSILMSATKYNYFE